MAENYGDFNCPYEYCSDCEGVYPEDHWDKIHEGELDEDKDPEEYKKYDTKTSWETLVQERYATERWETEGVWLTREEAEAYGKRRSYNYPDGWQVYGICAEGSLAKLLEKSDDLDLT